MRILSRATKKHQWFFSFNLQATGNFPFYIFLIANHRALRERLVRVSLFRRRYGLVKESDRSKAVTFVQIRSRIEIRFFFATADMDREVMTLSFRGFTTGGRSGSWREPRTFTPRRFHAEERSSSGGNDRGHYLVAARGSGGCAGPRYWQFA